MSEPTVDAAAENLEKTTIEEKPASSSAPKFDGTYKYEYPLYTHKIHIQLVKWAFFGRKSGAYQKCG
jgi:hypothetical protein